MPRTVTLNLTCDATQGEDISSLVRMAGSVIAVEPEMCEYVVHWPSKAGCPGAGVSGLVSLEAQGATGLGGGGDGGGGWAWWGGTRLAALVVAVLLYRDSWRKVVLSTLPAGARRWLRSGGDGSLLPSPRKSH